MARLPTTLGDVNVPRPARGIAQGQGGDAMSSALQVGARANNEGFQAVAKGLGDVSVALYNRQIQDDDREAKLLDVEYSKSRRQITKDFYATQGEGTLKDRPGLDKKLQLSRDAILKKATNGRVKQAFDIVSQQKTEAELGQADNYTEQQRRVANNTASEAVMTEAFQAAAEHASDDAYQIKLQANVSQEVDSQARNNGWDANTTKSKKQSAISQLYKNQIFMLAENQPGKANAVYQQNKENIDGDVRYAIENKLAAETVDALAQDAANQAQQLFPGNPSKQREWTNTHFQGKQYKAVIEELDHRLSEVRGDWQFNEAVQAHADAKIARDEATRLREERANIDRAGDSLYAALRGGATRGEWEAGNPEDANWLIKDSYRSETLDRAAVRIETDRQYATVTDSKSIEKYNGMTTEELAKVTDDDLELEKSNRTQRDWTPLAKKVQAAKASIAEAMNATSSIYAAADKELGQQAPRTSKGRIKVGDKNFNNIQADLHAWVFEQAQGGHIPTQDELAKQTQKLLTPLEADPENTHSWDRGPLGYFSPAEGEESFNGYVADYKDLSPKQQAVATFPVDGMPVALLNKVKDKIKERGLKYSDDLAGQVAAALMLGQEARYNQLLGIK